MSQDDETVERVAKHRLQHAMEMVRRDAAVTLTDEDVFALWGLSLSALPPRELLREALEALTRIHSELDDYVTDNDGEVGVSIAIAFEVARAAADKIRAALTQEHQT